MIPPLIFTAVGGFFVIVGFVNVHHPSAPVFFIGGLVCVGISQILMRMGRRGDG